MMRILALTGLLTLAAVSVTTVLVAQSAWERVRETEAALFVFGIGLDAVLPR